MFRLANSDLPPLDCHAHIAPDVTRRQLADLQNATVFAMTRSLEESRKVLPREDAGLLWGCGVHPGLATARSKFDKHEFRELLEQFVLVGEVGLDRRAGSLPNQIDVLRSILVETARTPVLVSLHSTGCTSELIQLLNASPQRGAILHWFLGDDATTRKAVDLGCYFSVNGAMSDEALVRIPFERTLPETDFPAASRRGGGRKPGDTSALEGRLSSLLDLPEEQLRRRWYRNLRSLAIASGAIERLPEPLANRLLTA